MKPKVGQKRQNESNERCESLEVIGSGDRNDYNLVRFKAEGRGENGWVSWSRWNSWQELK